MFLFPFECFMKYIILIIFNSLKKYPLCQAFISIYSRAIIQAISLFEIYFSSAWAFSFARKNLCFFPNSNANTFVSLKLGINDCASSTILLKRYKSFDCGFCFFFAASVSCLRILPAVGDVLEFKAIMSLSSIPVVANSGGFCNSVRKVASSPSQNFVNCFCISVKRSFKSMLNAVCFWLLLSALLYFSCTSEKVFAAAVNGIAIQKLPANIRKMAMI